MHLKTRNVNAAFQLLVGGIHGGEIPTVRRSSRNGPVIVVDEPITITYSHPRERVLFNRARDASPFLHLYLSLWMLAGRDDVSPLAYYARKMADYSDDGETLNGAYGYRWRAAQIQGDMTDIGTLAWHEHHGVIDQLKLLIEHLRVKPDSRRAVLSMWNVEDDLLKVDSSKDVCCNLCVCLSVDEGRLDATVFNRSNDLLWGTLGEDFVTFSVLQEYVAAHLGVEVGVYNQVSNNLHVYLNEHWKPEEFLKWGEDFCDDEYASCGPQESPCIFPLVKDPAVFDDEVVKFVEGHAGKTFESYGPSLTEPFLRDVADPMMWAFHNHKGRDYATALKWCRSIEADDWRYVVTKWIEKRKLNWERRDVR